MTYTVKYNRSSNHIDGIEERTTGTQMNYPLSACAGLTRGAYNMGTTGTYEDIREALHKAQVTARNNGNKMCKNCEKNALRVIEAEDAKAAEEAAKAAEVKVEETPSLVQVIHPDNAGFAFLELDNGHQMIYGGLSRSSRGWHVENEEGLTLMIARTKKSAIEEFVRSHGDMGEYRVETIREYR